MVSIKSLLTRAFEARISVKKLAILLILPLVMVAFMADSCTSQTQASQDSESQAAQKWGALPNITNYYEYLQLKQIYEARDNPKLVLNAYLFSDVTGQLTCLGKVVGFGVPYGTQWSQPVAGSGTGSVPEPNGLFPSTNTNADWIQLIGPDGKPHITFVEPNLIITDQTLPCKPLSA